MPFEFDFNDFLAQGHPISEINHLESVFGSSCQSLNLNPTEMGES